jgi:uncharacterized protein (DUF305 family)/plastocyanin
MQYNMKSYIATTDPVVTFCHQMIPHHQNAVNMAKVLMKSVSAADISAAMDEDGLTDILWGIINVQNFQIHQFRNYLGGSDDYKAAKDDTGTALSATSLGTHCDSTLAVPAVIPGTGYRQVSGSHVAGCSPSSTTICVSLNPFAGESGYYEFAGYVGSSPTITVSVGDSITFDQSDSSNWYHPIGFAYEPDGAHGSTWGGDELPEVEGKGELQYYIDGQKPKCADAGDTGLDCYEPEFFFPRGEWAAKKYSATLTITQAVADASHGGVLYYFCHIHSKMSGKIVISGSAGGAGTSEKSLYLPSVISPEDNTCGTFGVGVYGGGQPKACSERFLCGDIDTTFEKCLQAIDCSMNKEMKSEVTGDGTDKISYFMQQMIPHHQNAVNMAKLVLKQVPAGEISAAMDEDGLTDILWNIINVQNFQVHQFRNYLKPKGLLKERDIDDQGSEWRPAYFETTGAVAIGAIGLVAVIAALFMISDKGITANTKAVSAPRSEAQAEAV